MNTKSTGYGRQFRWSKRVTEGAITYRLFRRDHTGAWTHKTLEFSRSLPRAQIAIEVRSMCHLMREQVDAAQLKAWGYL